MDRPEDERPPHADDEGSIWSTLGTVAFVLSWPLIVLIALGVAYTVFRILVG